jgi:hypothetical protein
MILLRFMVWWAYFILRSLATGIIFIAGGVCHLFFALLFVPAGFMMVLQGYPITSKYWPWQDHTKTDTPPAIPLGWKDTTHEDFGGTDGEI